MKDVKDLTDDEIFDELREQVNKARFDGNHDRVRTREIADEAQKRNWNLRRPSELSDK